MKRNFRKKEVSSSDDEVEIVVPEKRARSGISAALLETKPKELETQERTYGLIEKRDFKHTLVRQIAMPEQQILKKSEMRRKDLIEQEIKRFQVPKKKPIVVDESITSKQIKLPMNKLIRISTQFKGIEPYFLGTQSRKKNEDDTDAIYRKLAQLGKLPEEAIRRKKEDVKEERVAQMVDGILFKVDQDGNPLEEIVYAKFKRRPRKK